MHLRVPKLTLLLQCRAQLPVWAQQTVQVLRVEKGNALESLSVEEMQCVLSATQFKAVIEHCSHLRHGEIRFFKYQNNTDTVKNKLTWFGGTQPGQGLAGKLILRDDDRETILMVGATLWSTFVRYFLLGPIESDSGWVDLRKGRAVPFIYAQRQKSAGPG